MTAFEARKLTRRLLNCFKGNLPDMDAPLEYIAPDMAADIADNEYLGGTVVHRDSDGNFALGIGALVKMPMLMYRPNTEASVNGGDPSTDKGVYGSTASDQGILAYPTNQPLELFSQQYDEDNEADFVPDALLTSPTSTALAGKLTVGTAYTDTIFGIVSKGVTTAWGGKGVAFWSIPPIFPN